MKIQFFNNEKDARNEARFINSTLKNTKRPDYAAVVETPENTFAVMAQSEASEMGFTYAIYA